MPVSYPHPLLTPIVGKPKAASVALLKKECFANATAAYSARGPGTTGCIRILLTDAEYLAKFAVDFDEPVHPGANPTIPDAPTQHQIIEANRAYKQNLEEFLRYEEVKADLKKMILAAIEAKYTAILEDDEMGYALVLPYDLLNHVVTTYGAISQKDLEDNRDKLKVTWDPTTEIEDLWTRINAVSLFATKGGEVLSDETTMRLTLNMFEENNIFETAVDAWHEKDSTDQTYVNFQSHFVTAKKTFNRKITAARAGFHEANAMRNRNPPPATPPPAPAPPPPPPPTVGPAATAGAVNLYYCHTHGLTPNSSHTSATCNRPADGHKSDATFTNLKGGSTSFWIPRSEFAQRRTTNN